jgi:uncharacterized protein (TIGR00251 family)
MRSVAGGVEFAVRVAPRASRTAVLGVHAGALKVSLTAPPVDGAANAALIAWFAELLGVAKSAIQVVRGEHGRNKNLRITGLTLEQLRAALAAVLASGS